MSEWISVEDRLPKIDRCLICCAKSGEIQIASVVPFSLASGGIAFMYEDDGDAIFGVTHWMPLPEPPQEKP